jgi:hypothetical protein
MFRSIHTQSMTEPIRAEIIRSNQCVSEGYSIKASAPVLAMCRRLLEAGVDPATPLHAYRDNDLCLAVSSIGWGAKHTVADNRFGTPVLQRYREPAKGAVWASPMRQAA